MTRNDLPIGDRKISEMIGNPESEVGATAREVMRDEMVKENMATKEYVTAMAIAFS
jgi:hypothetical protein